MTEEFTLYAPPDEMLELAKACLVGLCANEEAPHHRPRELAARAFDYAQAFYDELDARTAAAVAAEPTEPPASPLQTNDVEPDEIDEDPADSEPAPVAARVWNDLERAPQS
jgi:hypothetical protein